MFLLVQMRYLLMLQVVLAIYKSQKTGMPVKLPLENFASVDLTGMFGKGCL
mgnify:CR=1 FL=1